MAECLHDSLQVHIQLMRISARTIGCWKDKQKFHVARVIHFGQKHRKSILLRFGWQAQYQRTLDSRFHERKKLKF